MPKDKKIKPKQEHKQVIRYNVRTRPNYGSMAQLVRIKEEVNPMDLPILHTFSQYKYAQEFIEKEGDTANVYFINGDKWCWDKSRLWHKTSYHQVRSAPFAGSTKFVSDSPRRSNGVPIWRDV